MYTSINEWKKRLIKESKGKDFPIIKKDSRGNRIYFENPKGYWVKSEFDSNDNEIYHEDSTGYWWKSEYDSNGNEIYYENSSGYWWKSEFDSNGNKIYYETETGYWYKREYDSNGNVIYHEDSGGVIRDNRNINERKKRLIKESKNETTKTIAQQLRVTDFPFTINDSKGKEIYRETRDGYWEKSEFDYNGDRLYYENSDGYWEKCEYDFNGHRIYYETSEDGVITDNRKKKTQ